MALTLSLVPLCAQTTKTVTKQPNVWGKLKWGMTLAQAKSAYSGGSFEVVPNKEISRPSISIKGVEIGDRTVDVHVTAANGSTIDNITLDPNLDSQHGGTPSSRQEAFDEFKTRLIEKYGAPTNEGPKPKLPAGDETLTTVIWVRPSTTIHLYWSEREYQLGWVLVEYTPANRKNGM
jgi:hypothetical protein